MIKRFGFALIALVVAVAAAYPLADLLRETLDDGVRAALLREGKAQRFVKLPMGTVHVRVTGPADTWRIRGRSTPPNSTSFWMHLKSRCRCILSARRWVEHWSPRSRRNRLRA